ncbi:hypothetical protein P4639_14340 [Priestia megaterium]|uniref:hypothetical protein n=1 Tax=Priestia megaterium TaxID=1404 RepID=UPI002E21A571|nr:hypothetical protein [Priestia megaterium]
MNFTKGEMMIITGMTALVEEEGMHPREVIEKMRKLESDVFFALMEIYRETK